MRKRLMAYISAIAVMLSSMVFSGVSAKEMPIAIDGNPIEWTNVKMQSSDDSKIAKWAVMKDAEFVYFYVQQNGGNAWGLPITDTYITISYASGVASRANSIRFAGMMDVLKDGQYGDIAGTKQAYAPSSEANKYEIEFAVPQEYFEEPDYTLSYCGSKVKSEEIPAVEDVEEPQPTEAVYQGIKIDGTFTDWDAVAKVETGNKVMPETAMVFDGDFVYIYMKETSEGAITWSGECSNGRFTIFTDTGRHTSFKLNTDSVEGVRGAKVVHSNYQYEIAIPTSELRQYKETISFGYYMDKDFLIADMANLQGEDDSSDKAFHGIQYDGSYGDWDYFPHQLVQYSTPGGVTNDAEAALYQDGATLYGHVRTTLHRNEGEFQPFTIRINEKTTLTINFRMITADPGGNIEMNPQLSDLENGTYEYYLWDRDSGSTASNTDDKEAPIFGRIFVTVGASADEMEFQIDLQEVAKHLDMNMSDMKIIQAQYINIGTEWVTIAGTSTGAVMGISLCALTVVGVFLYRRKKGRRVV